MTQIYLMRNCAYNGAGNLSATGRAEVVRRGSEMRQAIGGIETIITYQAGRSIRQSAELLTQILGNTRLENTPLNSLITATTEETAPQIIVASNTELMRYLARINRALNERANERVNNAREHLERNHWTGLEV